jgi:hypothetical protein
VKTAKTATHRHNWRPSAKAAPVVALAEDRQWRPSKTANHTKTATEDRQWRSSTTTTVYVCLAEGRQLPKGVAVFDVQTSALAAARMGAPTSRRSLPDWSAGPSPPVPLRVITTQIGPKLCIPTATSQGGFDL